MAPGSLPPLALAYHAVGDVPLREDPHGLFVRAEDLRLHIAKLREWGYRLVSFGQLAALAAENEAGGHAALTFDDGFVDNLDTLAPLLAELTAPATVFVVSGWLGKPHRSAPWTRVVSAEELRALHLLGVEIGAHSVTPPRSEPGRVRGSARRARAEQAGSRSCNRSARRSRRLPLRARWC